MADIFLSYSREDEARIKSLVSRFEAQVWSVFWDRRIPAGETWRSHIGAALQDARCIVVAWSKHSIESQWVAEEADEGKARKALVPVLLDQVQPPRGFREIQAADISDWQPGRSSERLDQLIGDIRRILERQPESRQDRQKASRPPVAERQDESPHRVPSAPGIQVIAIAFVALLATGAIGYFFLRSPSSDRTATATSPNQVQQDRHSDATSPSGAWLVVAGSFRQVDRPSAERQRTVLIRAGIDAVMFDSNVYPLLTPNLWVVAIGPFDSKAAANSALNRVKPTVPDAYVKQGR
jgi:cell division protein FtsN